MQGVKDVTGQVFAEWTAIKMLPPKENKAGGMIPMVLCECSCGTIREVNYYNLTRGLSRSCGCLSQKTYNNNHDLTGKTFGQYYVESQAEDYVSPQGHHSRRWNVVCACGNKNVLTSHELIGGLRKMCPACSALVSKTRTHGKTGTRLYNVYREIRRRCYTKTNHNYKNYGGRGIRMCDEWKNDFMPFYEWAVMEQGYDENAPRGKYTIERIDVNGNYCPENCRLATVQEQLQNTRRNKYVEYNNVKYSLAEFSRLTNIPYHRINVWHITMTAEEMISRNQQNPCRPRPRRSLQGA